MNKSIVFIFFLVSFLVTNLAKPIKLNGNGEITGYDLTVTMNMSGIDPEKINVSLVKSGIVVDVHKEDSRSRKHISLPEGISPERMDCNLIDGMLVVTARVTNRVVPQLGPIPINVVSKESDDDDC